MYCSYSTYLVLFLMLVFTGLVFMGLNRNFESFSNKKIFLFIIYSDNIRKAKRVEIQNSDTNLLHILCRYFRSSTWGQNTLVGMKNKILPGMFFGIPLFCNDCAIQPEIFVKLRNSARCVGRRLRKLLGNKQS